MNPTETVTDFNAAKAPPFWTMTIASFDKFMSAVRSTPLYAQIIRLECGNAGPWWKMGRAGSKTCDNKCKLSQQKGQPPVGYLTDYNIEQFFVTPWTTGTGKGVALNMNPWPAKPKRVEAMISHAWGEDMECVPSQ